MSETCDETLAHIDAAIEDWEMGPDAASWRADGSHEHDPAWWTRADMGGGTFRTAEFTFQVDMTPWLEAMRRIAEEYRRVWERVEWSLLYTGNATFRVEPEGHVSTYCVLDETRCVVDGSRVVVPYEVNGRSSEVVIEPDLTASDVSRLFDVPEDMLTPSVKPSTEVRIPQPALRGLQPDLNMLVEAHNRRHDAYWTACRSVRSSLGE